MMKKLLIFSLAGAVLTACPVTAFAAEITQDMATPEGQTTVGYNVATDNIYTVVIPESVTLSKDNDVTGTIKIYGATENDNIRLAENKKINVALTGSQNNFNIVNANGSTLAYTVNGKNDTADLTTVAECAAASKKDTNITFSQITNAKYPGDYTDVLTFTISVEDDKVDVTGISLDVTEATMNAGSTLTLTATVEPDNATDKTVVWTSSNESVATVADGVVTAKINGSGNVTITATADGKSAECQITVNPRRSLTISGVSDYTTGKRRDAMTIYYFDGETWDNVRQRQFASATVENNGLLNTGNRVFISKKNGYYVYVTDPVLSTETYKFAFG